MSWTNHDKDEIFRFMGLAIAYADGCDFYLAEMFYILSETDNLSSYYCFGYNISADSRIEMLKIAHREYFRRKSKTSTMVLNVISKAKGLNSERNKIAHSSVWVQRRINSTEESRLFPAAHQYRRWKGGEKPNYIYKRSDVEKLALRIKSLYEELYEVGLELEKFDRRRHPRLA